MTQDEQRIQNTNRTVNIKVYPTAKTKSIMEVTQEYSTGTRLQRFQIHEAIRHNQSLLKPSASHLL